MRPGVDTWQRKPTWYNPSRAECNETAIINSTRECAATAPIGSIDTATLELLAAWKAEDATTDPEKLRQADEDVAGFKKTMNENRTATGARLLFL